MKNLEKIKGDASFRKYYRKKNKNYSSILVFTKKDKYKNLLVYDAINNLLIKNKILAPSLYKENYKKNFIEIQDFGDQTIFNVLKKKNSSKILYFKKIVKILIQMQLIKKGNTRNFLKKKYKIPQYKKKILIDEATLFCDWYIKKKFSINKRDKFKKKFKKIIKQITNNLKLKNNIFVHRDFHVSNLMLIKNRIGVIDSQDALMGNKAYDLASLIDDVRLKTSKSFKKKLYNIYINKQKKLEKQKFKNDFEILSVLRNLKIIGIFTRLSLRDGKNGYLKYIPYCWELINFRINENKKVFRDLKLLLDENFKKNEN